jgi:hypothetical protein
MEKQRSGSSGNNSHIILSIYVAVCTILVLIILLAPFQRAGSGVLEEEIYLKTSASESYEQ